MQYDPIHNPSSERPPEIELLRKSVRGPLTKKETKKLNEYFRGPEDYKYAFITKTAGDWLRVANDGPKVSNMLFGDFWYQGELAIMFADTNVGKSILAVQIGDSLSRSEAIPGFSTARKPEMVLYFDFELSAAQFRQRYSNDDLGDHYFSDDFLRLVFNPDANSRKFDTYAEYLNNSIENVLVASKARIMIIDNITCLRSGTEAAATAISLMRKLQAIKQQYGLSILVLAHTPKRNPAKPLSRNDLQGSKMLINFADSAFAIGESQTQKDLRYIKQIKQRSGNQIYGADNVCLCRLVKPQNFLHFEFTGQANEAAHLLHYTDQQRKFTENRILELHKQGISVRAIESETGIAYSTVFRLIRKLERVGAV
ncbi:AAA family ATPase [Mucilaginibacter sp. dw_454]|uniref:AAA family ATPase n=1 Tax=Mucilaginibacter sp. dw_454 TaxID=2720079 RepID=UPI001BD67DBD|nr:AAA family ATPase [Mucilaginibacter sp. dw_454]